MLSSATSVSGDWEDVTLPDGPVAAFLAGKGLAKFAEKIIEATDAESLDDLKLIDVAMVEEVIRAADLKLVSAKKLRAALAELRGEVPPDVAAPAPSAPAAPGPQPAPQSSEPAAAVQPQQFFIGEPAAPQEVIVVCIDRSGSMGTPMAEATVNVVEKAVQQRSRMEAVKVMFYAFRDRVESVGKGTHHMGLVQFDDKIERLLDPTARLDRFEAIVDDMQKRGSTAIYSSINEAVRMLEPYFSEDGPTDLRVIVLTDGQNNAGASSQQALEAVNRIGAVVDAIIVGDRPDADLRRIVAATQGECYQIGSLGEGFELLEAESVVSLRARRGGAEKPKFQRREAVTVQGVSEKSMVRGTAVARAPVLDATLASKKVVSAGQAGLGASLSSSSSTNGRTKRLLAELPKAHQLAHQGIHVFPAEDDVGFWRVLLEGPPRSPFAGGVFVLSVVVPQDYPFKPPKVTFDTPIYHCNVSDSGKICLDLLECSWSPARSISECLTGVRALLEEPDTDLSLRQWITELTLAHQKSGGTDTRYVDKARECTARDAAKTVDEWKTEWGC